MGYTKMYPYPLPGGSPGDEVVFSHPLYKVFAKNIGHFPERRPLLLFLQVQKEEMN